MLCPNNLDLTTLFPSEIEAHMTCINQSHVVQSIYSILCTTTLSF